MSKVLLITGATGKQGKEVVNAIFDLPGKPQFEVYGLSRSTSSSACQALSQQYPQLKWVQGDLSDCPAALAAVPKPIWGVFSVQTPMGSGQTFETEEQYGKALVDAAVSAGVKHFVYTSVERNGDNPTYVPHFIGKHNIETHLKNTAGSMGWTILRPTSFMDNTVGTAFFNKILGAFWRWHLGMDGRRQFIACKDIGVFAAKAFSQPDAPFYHNRAIGLAGDYLSFRDADTQMLEVLGRRLPDTYWPVVPIISQTGTGSMIHKMYRYFKEFGFHVDMDALRKEHPGLLTFREFLELNKAQS